MRGYQNALTGERINYARVKEATKFLSTALAKGYGLRQGDAVALFSPNNIWYPVAMLGTLRVGGVVSGASPAYNVEEMTYALRKAGPKFLMTVPSSMEVAAAAAKNAGISKDRVFLLEGEMAGFTTVNRIAAIWPVLRLGWSDAEFQDTKWQEEQGYLCLFELLERNHQASQGCHDHLPEFNCLVPSDSACYAA